jgi:hypothetical protein
MPIGDWFANLKGKMGDASQFLQSPEGRMLMAGIGTGLDPKGAGGAIGQPMMNMLRAKELRTQRKEQATSQEKWRSQLLKLLGGPIGITAPGKKGADSAAFKLDNQGRLKMSSVTDMGTLKNLFGDDWAPRAPGMSMIPDEEDIWR